MLNNNKLTIQAAQKLLSTRRITPTQLALYCYTVAERSQEKFNVFSNIFPLDETLASAARSDERYRLGQSKGILDGIPISIKCNISVKGKELTAGSDILNNVLGYDSHVAKRLKDSGAILIGFTNMDEFGMGSLGSNCNTGHTTNPIRHLKNDCSFLSSRDHQ